MNEQEFLDRLKKNRKPVTLFIGAGINPRVMPKWGDLVNTLLNSAVCRMLADFQYTDKVDAISKWIVKDNYSVYDQGNFIVNGLGTDYLGLVYNALYGDLTEDQVHKEGENLDLVAKLCLSRKISSVVTYNYDNLLEERIKKIGGRRVRPIFGERMRPVPRGIMPIYHVHGYLPWRTLDQTGNENDIVFGLEEYHRQYYEQARWQTTAPLHLIENNFSIFIGTSLRDMDMLSLRSFSRQYSHNKDIYLVRAYNVKEEKSGKSAAQSASITDKVQDEISRIHFESLGVTQITVFGVNSYKPYTAYLKRIATAISGK
jgi:hypothetical protein